MDIIAIYNTKGGVGKTATAVNLSLLSARAGARTLICDLDPQGSTSFYFRVRPNKRHSSKLLVSGGKALARQIKATDFARLDLLPADFSYRKLDLRFAARTGAKKQLARLLRGFADEYERIFIDSPPNITLVSENIFQAATTIIMPVIPTTLSMLTYEKTRAFLKRKRVRTRVIPFFSMVEKRKTMHVNYYESVTQQDASFCRAYIPYASDIEKMGVYRQPIVAVKPQARASQAYRDLWREITIRLQT